MNYQNLLCVGDSQTVGARSYGCYPLHLARLLTEQTDYAWRTINLSSNGETARDLWFRLPVDLERVSDTFQACLMIGTNDVGEGKPMDLFEEYLRQILRSFFVSGYKAVYCAEIPPIHADGHVFFPRSTAERRDAFNEVLRRVVAEYPATMLVPIDGLTRDCYEDPVHFNEEGNRLIAAAFAEVIRQR